MLFEKHRQNEPINADFTYVRENLHNIQAPSLIFWGTTDRIHEKWMMDEIVSNVQGSKLIIVPNAGHMPYDEAVDKFNSEAIKFLINRSKV